MGKIDLFLKNTWLYLYSTGTIGATVLSQKKKNFEKGSEGFIDVIMTLDDSQMTLVRILSILWGCVTETTVLQA